MSPILRSVSMSQEPTAMRNRSPAIFILALLDMTQGLSMSTMLITITRTYCHEEQESSYLHSRIVGHDSRVVDEYHADHYHKRAAEAGNKGYYTGPQCQDKQEQECHKHPHENSRKIP